MLIRTTIWVLVGLAAGCANASAQNAGDVMKLFGSFNQMAQDVIVKGAQAEWRKIPPEQALCMDRALQQRGSNLPDVVGQGITPSDPRIADIRARTTTRCQG